MNTFCNLRNIQHFYVPFDSFTTNHMLYKVFMLMELLTSSYFLTEVRLLFIQSVLFLHIRFNWCHVMYVFVCFSITYSSQQPSLRQPHNKA